MSGDDPIVTKDELKFYGKLKMVDKYGSTETRWFKISEETHDQILDTMSNKKLKRIMRKKP